MSESAGMEQKGKKNPNPNLKSVVREKNRRKERDRRITDGFNHSSLFGRRKKR